MDTRSTLAAYAAGLAVTFAAALGVGSVAGPLRVDPVAADAGHGASTEAGHGASTEAGHAGSTDAAASAPVADGLAVSDGGWTLQLEPVRPVAGRPTALAFRVLGADGAPLTHYVEEHEKELHLVVVRRDATGFQHLHPVRHAAGRWSTPVTFARPGTYKVFADFRPQGEERGRTLAVDVTVPGAADAAVLPPEQRTATVDGYTVRLVGDLTPGAGSPLTLSVSQDGRPVGDLQPYLGAYGHLVVLRAGDLAYLHVHPEDPEPRGDTGGPDIRFVADVPSAGDYRLFLDFRHDGVVRTAAFTLPAGALR